LFCGMGVLCIRQFAEIPYINSGIDVADTLLTTITSVVQSDFVRLDTGIPYKKPDNRQFHSGLNRRGGIKNP
jgi:hypothetical protein